MKGLVVGGGSIGTRHLNNLRSLGIGPLALVEPDSIRRKVLCDDGMITGFNALEEGLSWDPDLVIIATPTHFHIQQALEVANEGYPLFIEKPLSCTDEGLKELSEEITKRKITSLVGCNMRFHPGPANVKRLLEQKAIGKLLFARIHTGSYLPSWRPSQDYRKSYSACQSMGGGCILDCIHEVDLARWYLGEVENVFCAADHLSSMEIDVEDVAVLICRHAGGTLSEVHLDYVQRTYERGCQIVGEKGTIFWDFNEKTVRLFDAEKSSWTAFPEPKEWNLNQMYIDELKHFLDCVRTDQPTTLPVPEATKVMQVVFAAKESVNSGRMEGLRRVNS